MDNQTWSWVLTAVGVTGFVLAGRKVWFSWYINLACQILWFVYAIATSQYGFIAAALVYTVVFGRNAYAWTYEKFWGPKMNLNEIAFKSEPTALADGYWCNAKHSEENLSKSSYANVHWHPPVRKRDE